MENIINIKKKSLLAYLYTLQKYCYKGAPVPEYFLMQNFKEEEVIKSTSDAYIKKIRSKIKTI